jgi:hypothetical protein
MHLIANSFIKNANLAVVLCFVHEKKKYLGFESGTVLDI